MKKIVFICFVFSLTSCAVQHPDKLVKQNDVARIIRILSADDMQGRAIFTPGIEKAAKFIESEFKQIGLQPLSTQKNYRQEFSMLSFKPASVSATVNGEVIAEEAILVVTDNAHLSWGNATAVEVKYIKSGEPFMVQYRRIMQLKKPVMVFVDDEFNDAFQKVHSYFMGTRVLDKPSDNPAAVFILGVENATTYQINFSNAIQKLPLFNIAGIIPGKTKPDEFVIFSGHYDHLGIIEEASGDS
ncbi:MAG: hypothetical protein H7Y07_03575, partial [Pyrinomonadaceae bacterium]|nr:hypothetical protein [Sphingobacteriaceae bacterium]